MQPDFGDFGQILATLAQSSPKPFAHGQESEGSGVENAKTAATQPTVWH